MVLKQETDPDICAVCAKTEKTCCQVAPGGEKYFFPLSLLEKDLILTVSNQIYVSVQKVPFWCEQENCPDFIKNLLSLFPKDKILAEQVFAVGQKHLRLSVDAQGFCLFYGKCGCLLPRQYRPLFCRIYPFWVYGQDIITFDAQNCLANKKMHKVRDFLVCFNVEEKDIFDLYFKIRKAWGLSI